MNHRILLIAGAAAAALSATAHAAPAAPAAKAPTAKTAASAQSAFSRLPDWTGVWETDGKHGTLFDDATAEPPTSNGQGLSDRIHPPYTPEYEARYDAILAKHKAGIAADPLTSCVPAGYPRMLALPYQHEFVVRPEAVWHITEYDHLVRRIYTDGRPQPKADDLWPMWNAHSIGHWEGDTLVVEAISMRGDSPFDRSEAPHSDKLKVQERWRKIDPTHIEVKLVLTDPVAFTRPWLVTRRFRKVTRVPDGGPPRIDDIYPCGESQRNPVVNGQTQTLLKDDPPGYVQGAFPDRK